MQYMLMIYGNEAGMQSASKADAERMLAAYGAYTQAMKGAGVLVASGRLKPSTAASTVRVADGKTKVLDGPYAETKEQLGGYYLIEVPDLDGALSWAARCPGASHPALWDADLIAEAEALLLAASRMGAVDRYQLEAAVQSAHAVRRSAGRADWAAIRRLYDALEQITGSPVVAINRAIAIAETEGPAAGLAALAALEGDGRLSEYQPYWAARAALLASAGDIGAADAAYEKAIGLESDPAVRRFLQRRRAAMRGV